MIIDNEEVCDSCEQADDLIVSIGDKKYHFECFEQAEPLAVQQVKEKIKLKRTKNSTLIKNER